MGWPEFTDLYMRRAAPLVAVAFAQQFRIRLRLLVPKLIQCLIGRSERRRLDFLLDGLNILHRFLEALPSCCP